MSPTEILRQYWGYSAFRPLQEEIIQSVLDQQDTFAILPTGGGKSICYQVPAMVLEGCCLVVTPLVALMQDQVQQLEKRGIAAVALHSGLQQPEVRDILRQAAKGQLKFLYVSPERLGTNLFREALPWLPLSFVAVDEAHCISQWGYDFRPSYLDIASLREARPQLPILAVTASATPDVQQDILDKLTLRSPAVFRQSFERPNLSYSVFRVDARMTKLREIIDKVPGTAIIYCRTRKRTTEIASILQERGISAAAYHAGLPSEDRRTRQTDWIENRIRVMVCTNAFGMGIDKPDVRLVIHTAPPDCLENYYQEAGRAGRDGKRAYAVLLYHSKDREELLAYPDLRFPSMPIIRNVYQALANYLQLPVGLGQDTSYALDLQDFVRKFKLQAQEVIYVLQALQQGGVLSFQEQLFQPSTVLVTAARPDLDALESMHPDLDHLLKILLRNHGGAFDNPVSISEKNLAWLGKTTIDVLTAGLQRLRRMGLIVYKPRRESPQVRFLQNRVQAGDLYIDPLAYKARKTVFEKRIKAMADYLVMETGCRSVTIGRYFGDQQIQDCGVCDLCFAKKKDGVRKQEYQEWETRVKEALSRGPLTAGELLKKLHPMHADKFWQLLGDWTAERWIITGKDGKLRLS